MTPKEMKPYFSTLQTECPNNYTQRFRKIEFSGYSDLGFCINSILSICREAMEQKLFNQINVDNSDYSRLLELVQNLIPFPELELLDNLHFKTLKNSENADD